MIRRKKGAAKKALNRLLSRSTFHKTGVDTRALEGKVDLLPSVGKGSEADVGEIRKSFAILSREMGAQHEALADRFRESTIEIRRALDILTATVGRQHETLAGGFAESAGETRQALNALVHAAGEQREVLASRIAESVSGTQQALEALTDTMAQQHATLAGCLRERAEETRQAMETAIAKSGGLFQARMATFVKKIEMLERLSFRQHEALAALSRIFKTQHPLPATRGWAASPDLLLYLYEYVLERKPAIVVELGGGVSSLVIAAALKTNGQGRLLSFDHDVEYAARTTALLDREGFADVAAIEHAPLSQWLPSAPNGLAESWEWYTLPEDLRKLSAVDLLVVDGPPENTGAYARYPALPALADKLVPGATVLLDDTIREDETKIAQAWRDEFGFDLLLRSDFEKGLAILRRRPEEGLEGEKR